MTSANDATRSGREEALRHIHELTAWLESHKLSPEQVQARRDRVAALARWSAYLERLDRRRKS